MVSETYAQHNPNSTTKVVPKAAPSFGGSLPMHEQGEDSTTTKATLTEGKITLNKDSQSIQTTAKALGINTNLSQANKQVAEPKEVNQLLQEQKTITEAVGHIATAATNFSHRQAEDLEEEAKEAEKAGDYQRAKAKRKEAESWQTGGENKRKVDAITTALSLALAGQSPQAIATGAASPYINQGIKEITENYPELNIPAHILWGAIEAELTGGKATTGAIAAGVGELAAPILSQALYGNKKPNELTDAEKQQVLNLSKLVAGIASGLTATGNSAENLVTISQGMKVAENAVENNNLGIIFSNPEYASSLALKAEADAIKQEIIEKANEEVAEEIVNAADKYVPHYISISGQMYGIGGKFAINLRNGDVFSGGTFSPIAIPNRFGSSLSANLGWVTNLDTLDIKTVNGKRITDKTISKVMEGTSFGVSGCYTIGCIGYSQTLSNQPKDKKFHTFELGIGLGGNGGNINQEKTYKIGSLDGDK